MHEEIDVNTILEPAATRVRDPISGRSIWFSNMIKQPALQDHTIMFEMHYTPEHTPQMKESVYSLISIEGGLLPFTLNWI